jgi:hypothetical protein
MAYVRFKEPQVIHPGDPPVFGVSMDRDRAEKLQEMLTRPETVAEKWRRFLDNIYKIYMHIEPLPSTPRVQQPDYDARYR